jgi:hypothetical protein
VRVRRRTNKVAKSQYKVITLALLLFSSSCLCMPIVPPEPPPKEETRPSWAPDGQSLVYECYLDGPVQQSGVIDRLVEPNGRLSFYTKDAADLCLSNVNKRDQVRLTNDPGGDWYPIWSPDGSRYCPIRMRIIDTGAKTIYGHSKSSWRKASDRTERDPGLLFGSHIGLPD